MTDQLDIFGQDLEGLDEEELKVWKVVRDHTGRENAVKVSHVCWKTGLVDRRVRAIVSHLVNEHGKLIASVTGQPPGYYIIPNREEFNEHTRSMTRRAIKTLVRVAALKKTSVEEIFKQGVLDLDEAG